MLFLIMITITTVSLVATSILLLMARQLTMKLEILDLLTEQEDIIKDIITVLRIDDKRISLLEQELILKKQ